MINRHQDTATRRGVQTKNTPGRPADPQNFPHHSERDTQSPRRQRARIRKIFLRALQRSEVDFLLSVWKAGAVRVDACPAVAASLLRRGWISRGGRHVRLSEETNLLLKENVK